MSEPTSSAPVESPPPALRPIDPAADEPRAALNRLAAALAHSSSPRLLLEFLRLRRALRGA